MLFPRLEITKYSKKVYARGWNTLMDGNISVRRGNTIWMTPSKKLMNLTNESIRPWHVCCWNLKDDEGPAEASIEWRKHEWIYQNYPCLNAVIHCHAIEPTVLGRNEANVQLLNYLPEFTVYGSGPVVSEDIIPTSAMSNLRPIICPNHGVTVFGGDLEEAYQRLERLIYYSRMILLANK